MFIFCVVEGVCSFGSFGSGFLGHGSKTLMLLASLVVCVLKVLCSFGYFGFGFRGHG